MSPEQNAYRALKRLVLARRRIIDPALAFQRHRAKWPGFGVMDGFYSNHMKAGWKAGRAILMWRGAVSPRYRYRDAFDKAMREAVYEMGGLAT